MLPWDRAQIHIFSHALRLEGLRSRRECVSFRGPARFERRD